MAQPMRVNLDGAFVGMRRAARRMVAAGPLTRLPDADAGQVARPGVPLGRVGAAHEMAAVIAFLCSDASSYVTGASFVADGGMLQMGPMGASDLTGDDWRSA